MRNGDKYQHASYYGYGKKLEPAGKPKSTLNRSEVKSSPPNDKDQELTSEPRPNYRVQYGGFVAVTSNPQPGIPTW